MDGLVLNRRRAKRRAKVGHSGACMSDFDYSILHRTSHRPWPLPESPWVMTQSWHDLLFAHWRVDVAQLRRVVPRVFDLDLFEGEAWVGVVPFHMSNVGLRATPALPWLSAFPELNVRTYVRVEDRPGVYFFSLDAARRLAVAAARLVNLPYFVADMTVDCRRHRVQYESSRRTTGRPAQFSASYKPVGEPAIPVAGSLEYFLTERYCLYNEYRRGRPYRLDIHHAPWSLQRASATISLNSMATANDLTLPAAPPLLHFARRQDVVAWAPTSIPAAVTEKRRDSVVSRGRTVAG
jgi:uncharacterized protein YqjF (DUF2071 family)